MTLLFIYLFFSVISCRTQAFTTGVSSPIIHAIDCSPTLRVETNSEKHLLIPTHLHSARKEQRNYRHEINRGVAENATSRVTAAKIGSFKGVV